ncbi:MAG: AAA family ATPase [Candidatus Moranbacteria bacterium]|jgi:dephospho-CoA kinase|nr:AAA family ATPase [Candidatus Moranbacteria bacterium]
MQKIIIGVAGEIASGKDTVGKYIAEKYNALPLRFSQLLRDILDRMGLEQNREHMAKLSLHLRKGFGDDILSKGILAEAEKSDKALVVVDGIRRLPDMIQLEMNEHFYFAYVESSSETRYERLTKRRQNADDEHKTPAQFEKDAQLETESQIRDLKERADFVINNDGTLEELQKQVDEMIATVKSK